MLIAFGMKEIHQSQNEFRMFSSKRDVWNSGISLNFKSIRMQTMLHVWQDFGDNNEIFIRFSRFVNVISYTLFLIALYTAFTLLSAGGRRFLYMGSTSHTEVGDSNTTMHRIGYSKINTKQTIDLTNSRIQRTV